MIHIVAVAGGAPAEGVLAWGEDVQSNTLHHESMIPDIHGHCSQADGVGRLRRHTRCTFFIPVDSAALEDILEKVAVGRPLPRHAKKKMVSPGTTRRDKG